MSTRPPRITLYSTPACSYCRQARLFLNAHKLRFQEFNVQHSSKARRQLERMGARGVPVIMVGNQRLDGFQAGNLRQALARTGVRL